MFTSINHKGKTYKTDLGKPIDISIPLRAKPDNVNAWYVPSPTIEPVRMGDWVGDVNQGGSVNFRNIFLYPIINVIQFIKMIPSTPNQNHIGML